MGPGRGDGGCHRGSHVVGFGLLIGAGDQGYHLSPTKVFGIGIGRGEGRGEVTAE
ncbi:MAG: hypothetical protein ACRDYD_02800 [Acidimicrobiales bacterium]